MSDDATRALDQAQGLAAQRQFVAAVRSCLPVLQGPQRGLDVLQSLCLSLERAEAERDEELSELAMERQLRSQADRRAQHLESSYDEELRSLMSKLLDARERADAWQQRSVLLDGELAAAVMLRQESERQAERQADVLLRQVETNEAVLRENAKLKQQLNDANASSAGVDEVARQVADFECEPLRQSDGEQKLALKRKLLVKWHPDKQPSAEHVALATQVMQELQNRPEWGS